MTVDLEEQLSTMVKEIHRRLTQGSLPFASAPGVAEVDTEVAGKMLGVKAQTVRGYIAAKKIEGAYQGMDNNWRIPLASIAKCRKGAVKSETDAGKKAASILQLQGLGRAK